MNNMELEIVNKLFLELSQVATVKTKRELNLEHRKSRREYELEQLLRSACAIAERKGEDTHWENFLNSAKALGINGVTARHYRVPRDI